MHRTTVYIESFPELEPEFNAVGSPGVPGDGFIHVLTNRYYNVWNSVMLLRVLLIVKVLVLWGGILGEVPSGSKSVGFTKQK